MFRIFKRERTQSEEPASEAELKDRGNRFLAKGELREAENCYRLAIAANADSAVCHLNLGFVLNEQGRRAEAAHALRQAVALDPALADAWYILGTIAQAQEQAQAAIETFRRALDANPQLDVAYPSLARVLSENGQPDAAIELVQKGIAINPQGANLHLSLGNLLVRGGAWDDAIHHFRAELAIQPDLAEAHFRLADALHRKGALPQAAQGYEATLAIVPDWADAHQNLGNVWTERGEWGRAIGCYRRVIELTPDFVDAHNNLGVALQEQGELDAAIASYRQALSLQPDYANVHCNLGMALHLSGESDRALGHFRRAVDVSPDCFAAHHNLGSLLLKQGDVGRAIACFREALRIDPGSADAYLNLGNAHQVMGDIPTAMAHFRRAMKIDSEGPSGRAAHSNLIVMLGSRQGSSAEYLLEARRYGEHSRARARPYVHATAESAPQVLRVGFVSGDFRQHPVGYFLENVLTHLASRQVSLVAYSTTSREDALTARMKSRFSGWNLIANLSDEAAAARIHGDGIDVLIDLAGHTEHNRLPLFAWEPAPVQVSWLGYWASTGTPGVDYFLADRISVPAGREADFSEAIWHLPDTRLCFTPPADNARLAVTPPPAMRNGQVTFACFQNLGKVNDESLALWGVILRALPDSRMRLQDKHLDYPEAREQLQRRLADAGISSDRVAMHGRMPREAYLAAYAEVDIVLDTFPFSGGTTTCEALWMGVPTLTLAGQSLVARQGASMLTCVGLADWIAGDADAYVAKALQYAADIDGLAMLRSVLRPQALASPLFDAARFAGHLEAALRAMWRQKMVR